MSEEAQEGRGAEAPAKKKVSLGQILIGVQLVVLLACAAVIGKVALFPKKVDLSPKNLKDRAIASVRDDEAKIQFVEFDEFTVNLPQRHTLKAKLQIEVSDPEVAAVVMKRKAAIKARILYVLSSQPMEGIEGIQGKLLMKDAIREAVSSEVNRTEKLQGIVRDVYFMEFLMVPS